MAVLVVSFDGIYEASFSVVLLQCPYLHIRVNLTFFCHDLVFDSPHVFVWVCHSGGRTITVTGQGFDLVQSAAMQVEGIGQTVSNWLP